MPKHEKPATGEPRSPKENAPEPDVGKRIEEDLSPEAREELEERAQTGTSVRAEEPDEGRTAEYGHTYMGRTMDDRLKANPRPRDEDELTE